MAGENSITMVVDSTAAQASVNKLTESLLKTTQAYDGTQQAASRLGKMSSSASALVDKLNASLSSSAKAMGLFYDQQGRLRQANGRFATDTQKAIAQVDKLSSSVSRLEKNLSASAKASASATNKLSSLAKQALAAYSAYQLMSKAVSAVNIGIQANQAWESQKLSIASVIGATNNLADAQGRVLQGSEKFAASQELAAKMMERIQQLGLETTATTQSLVEGVQGIIAPATRVGISLEQIPDLAVNAAQAMGAMQIPLQQMRTEIESLLSGNINKAQDILATNLGITGEMVRNWQKQGTLLEELNKRLESFKLSGEAIANTWGGLTSNLKEYVEFISRGATEGLFNSLKSSAREFQSLLISINEQTGRPEVSNKVNNLVAAYERLNDVIGNKIYAATREFAYWLEELNKPENLAELEKQVSSLWDDFSGVASAAWEVAKVAGSIAETALNGFNSLPQWAQEVGIIGGIFLGTRAKLAIAGIAYLVEISKNLDSSLSKLQNMGDNSSLMYQGYGDYSEEYEKAQQKIRESSRKTKNDLKGDIENVTEYMHSQLEERREKLSLQLEQEKEAYEEFYRVANFDLVDESARDYASQKAKEASEQIRIMETELDSVTSTLKNIYTEADSLDWYELMNPDPINDTAVAFAGLLTTSSLFGKSVMTAKDNVDALDGSSAVASIDFRINTNAGSLFSDAGQGTMFALPQWSETWKTILEKTRVDIEATGSTAGKTADKAKSKIESALHSVESELNKLQMTDAQYKQWQVDEKVEKLEKLLGKTNPKVVELRNALQNELNDNLFKDTLEYANPTAAAVAKVDKEYEDWKKNLEQLKKQAPEKYNKLIAENTDLMTTAQREYNNALEQAESVYINFRKETEDIRAQSLLSEDDYFAYQTNRKIEEWEKQGQSRADIDERVNALLLQHNKQYSANFADMWKETYNRVDQAGADMLENFLNGSKNTFDSLKKMFIRTLAEMANAAWLRPITVQVMGTLGGVFGLGGSALAYNSAAGQMVNGASGSGGLNAGGVSNLMPSSWTSGIADTINDTMAGWFPGTFSSSSALAGSATANSAIYEMAYAAGDTTTAFNALADSITTSNAAASGQGTFLSGASPYFAAAGLGSMGYSLLGGALGLPQNKYSGVTSAVGSAAGYGLGTLAAGAFSALGATAGSVVPVVGTIIGAALGGALSGLFGSEKKTHPSVYTNVTDQSLFDTDWKEALVAGAWTDRASVSDVDEIFDSLAEIANGTATSILDFAKALPDEYGAQVLEKLNEATVSFGRGSTAGRGDVADRDPLGSDWNFQTYSEERLQESLEAAGTDIQRVMLNALSDAVGSVDMSAMFSSLDFSSTEGLEKAMNAINSVNAITDAIDGIREPQTQAEQQAEAFVEQMNALEESVKSYGLSAQYAEQLVGEYRTAYVDSYVEALDEMFNPLSQIEQQAQGYKEAIDGYVSALTTMQASEEQLATVRGYTQTAIDSIIDTLSASLSSLSEYEQAQQDANAQIDQRIAALRQLGATEAEIAGVEAKRAEVVKRATEEMLRSFEQSTAQRWAKLNGTSDAVSRAISQENELREAIQQFGESSAQVAELLKLQAAETAQAALTAATSEYDNYLSQMQSLEAQRVQVQQQAIQAEISAINEQLSAAKTLKNTWESLEKSLRQSRENLWSGSNNLDLFSRLSSTQSEFDRLYAAAMGGDSEAAGQLASVGNTLLGLQKQTASGQSQYLDAFYDVDQKLKAAQFVASNQLTTAERQLSALQSQLDVQNSALAALQEQTLTLSEIDAQIASLRPILEAALAAKNAAQNVVTNTGGGGGSSSSSSKKTTAQIIAEKVDSLNRGEYIDTSFGIGAGGWNVQNTVDAMVSQYGSVQEWYKQAGKYEGFASGGLTPEDEIFKVGEHGEELMLSPSRWVVLNNDMTRKLEDMAALQTQSYGWKTRAVPSMSFSGTMDFSPLISELREVKDYMRQLLVRTGEGTGETSKIRKMLRKWDDIGMPPFRDGAAQVAALPAFAQARTVS